MYNNMLRFHRTNYNGTNSIRPKQLILMFFSFCGFLFVESSPLYAQAKPLSFLATNYHYQEPESEQSLCLYGEVYYRGLPVPGAKIDLRVNEQTDQLFTHQEDEQVQYSTKNRAIGQVARISAEFAGKNVERVIRLMPDEIDLQKVDLVIPHESIWEIWHPNTNIYDLQIFNDTMIAASESGIRKLPLDTMPEVNGASGALSHFTLHEPFSPHLLDIEAIEIAVDRDGLIWALDDQDVYRQQGVRSNHWVTYSLPINVPLYALKVDRASNVVWVGGGNDQLGKLAMYDGTEWSHVYSTDTSIRALAFDSQNNLWVGTWGSGVYLRNSEGEWTQYTTDNGLASDYIHTISVIRPTIWDGETIWFGSAPLGTNETENIYNGISSYDPTNQMWRTYTVTHGLPADEQTENAVTHVYDFAVDRNGVVWAGTEKGLYLLGNDAIGHEKWVLHDPDINGLVRSILFRNGILIAATSKGLMTLLPNPLHSSYVSKRLILEDHPQLLKLKAESIHEYPQHEEIVWSWVSEKDGPLCSTPYICTYPKRKLRGGNHKIQLYLQDRSGRKSIAESISVKIGYETFLPMILRHK